MIYSVGDLILRNLTVKLHRIEQKRLKTIEGEADEEKLLPSIEDLDLKEPTETQVHDKEIFTSQGKGGRVIRGPFSTSQ